MGTIMTLALAFALQTGTSVQLPPGSRAPSVQAGSGDYTFPSGAGLLFFYVKPDKVADFDAVMARLAEVLDKTEDPVRKQQAATWRVLKSAETTPDATIYVFAFIPAIAGTDYDPIKVMSEAIPAEAQALYEKLRGAVIRVERMGLTRIR
jgi:hypothetical protein